jgi:hypothetical protein
LSYDRDIAMMKYAILLFGLLLGCGLYSTVTTGNSNGYVIPAPSPGQWASFGGNEAPITQGAQPSWAIPCCSGSQIVGYYYTQLAAAPKAGQALTLNYTYTANNPVYVQAPASGGNSETDINPPTIHVLLWRRGDDLSCTPAGAATDNGGYADYSLFAGRTLLVPGANQVISVPLTAVTWTGCYGKPPVNIQDELSNLVGAGVTFGGQSFAGHGVYLSSGSATFKVNSLTVQ